MLDFIFGMRQQVVSFEVLGIVCEEKTFSYILITVKEQFAFEYPEDKALELARVIKMIVDNKTMYIEWSDREDIKAKLKMDIIVKLAEFGYPPVTKEAVYKNVLEQAENFKRNRR